MLCVVIAASVVEADDAAQLAVQRLRDGIAQLAAGQSEVALQTFTTALADASDPDVVARARCGAGQALAQLRRHEEAIRYFEAALDTRGQQVLRVPSVHLSAAASALQSGDTDTALKHLERCLAGDADPATVRSARLLLVQTYLTAGTVVHAWQEFLSVQSDTGRVAGQMLPIALNIGLQAYRDQQPATAREALQWYLRNHDSTGEPDADAYAVLAWMDADDARQPGEAARIFETFAKQHPKSYRANAALLAAADHRIRQRNFSDAVGNAAMVLENAVATQEEIERALWVRAMHDTNLQRTAEAIGRLLPQLTDDAQRDKVADRLVEIALHSEPDEQFAVTLQSLLALQRPRAVIRLLDRIAESGDESRVADLVDQTFQLPRDERGNTVSAGADAAAEPVDLLAAVCRWLAESSRHHVVGLQLDNLPPADAAPFSAATELWLAENLMQLGRNADAAERLERIAADQLPPNLRFHHAIRDAELAIENSEVDVAQSKLAQLRQQTAVQHQTHQVAILEANFFFRTAQFDAARERLESVVRHSASAELQGRAQWLIGESWFMQHEHVKAIDAYRTAESLGRRTIWRWLALLQAGKCFDALERPPEAVACYTALLTPEAPPAYRQAAAMRLAALSPETLQR